MESAPDRVVTAAVIVGLLLGYWALMVLVPVPGFGAGDLGKEGNLAAYIDRAVLGPHIWRAAKVYDPEGILSTLPAIATTLAGVLTGQWLRASPAARHEGGGMAGAGIVAVVLGLVWGRWFPDQQGAVDQLVCRLHRRRRPPDPRRLRLAGGDQAMATLGDAVRRLRHQRHRRLRALHVRGAPSHPREGGGERRRRPSASTAGSTRTLFAPWATPTNASLLFALAYVLVWLAVMGALYRRRIFIRV